MDPAALMVNKIANKKIEHNRLRRQQEAARQQELKDLPQATPEQKAAKKPAKQLPRQELSAQEEAVTTGTPSKAADMMNTIDLDISAPMFGKSAAKPKRSAKAATPVAVEGEDLETVIPSRMPQLDLAEEPKSIVLEPEQSPKPAEPPQDVKKEK